MKNKTFKKSLSVLMTVLMLMSSWVFFPGMVTFEAEAAEIEQLKSLIEDYEGYFSNGTFYTNLQSNYNAYNDAKRYYDAVKYGGVVFDTAVAQKYMDAIDTAIANTGANGTFINYLNTPITGRGGKSVSETYRKNVIYYPYDFSYDITSNDYYYTPKGVRFFWSNPNVIVGITDENNSTFPITCFYFKSTTSYTRYVRYIIIGTETAEGTIASTSVLSGGDTWRLSATTNSTSSDSGGTPGTDSWGDWYFEEGYTDTRIPITDVGNVHSHDVGAKYLYQVSNYVKINNNNLGVDADNIYKNLNLEINFGGGQSDGWTGNGTDWSEGTASSTGMGYVHTVYMQTYKDNFENWKTLIPYLSYADYDGFVYTSAGSVAKELDAASAYDLSLGNYSNLTGEAGRSGDISGSVTQWATNINAAAGSLKAAKAAGTTRVTNKYVDLINAIANSEADYAAGSAKFTYSSWNTFKTAYDAARAHMASLNPSGSNVQYSSDATVIGNLATALDNARNALTLKTFDVTFDNLFNYSKFTIGGNLTVIERTDTGFTVTSTASDGNTGFSTAIPVEPGKTYIFSADVSIQAVSGGYDMYIHTLDSSMAGETTATPDVSNGAHREGSVYISLTGQTTNKTPYIKFTAGDSTRYIKIRFDANAVGNVLTVNNIRVYEDGKVADGVSYVNSKTYTYGDTYGTLPTPTRTGYTFAGWVDGNGNTPTGTITDNTALYSTWTINKYTVTFEKADGSVASAQYDYGTAASAVTKPANTAKNYDATNHYEYSWPTINDVTADVTYEEIRTPAAHDMSSSVTKEPTCTATGIRTYTCSGCSYSYTEEIQMKEHTPGAAATCTAPQTCTVCGTELVAKLGHTEVTVAGKEATCTETGLTDGKKCSVCGETTVAQTVIPVLGHTEVTVAGKEATCTETGLTEGKKCSVCGEILVKQEVVNKLSHTAGEAVKENIVSANCSADGSYDSVVKCTVCGTEIIREKITIGALGHLWSTDYVSNGNNGSEGTHYRTCTRENCGEKDTSNHTWSEGVIDPDSTCTQPGIKTYTCMAHNCGATYTETVALKAHNLVKVEAKAPTCTVPGYEAYEYCADCSYTTFKEVSALGHTEVTVAGKEATCTETGLTEGKKCSVCGETTVAQTVIPALGHTEVTVAGKEATCTETGLTDGKKCSVCGETTVAQEVIPALGHKAGSAVKENEVPASCGADGSYEIATYCTVCDTELSRVPQTVPATGNHNYAAEVEGTRNPATCIATGSVTMKCGCGATEVQTLAIDKDNHVNIVTDTAVEATCTKTGLTEGSHCGDCDKVLVAQTVTDKKSHTPAQAVEENRKESTCKEAGSYDLVVRCSLCDAVISSEKVELPLADHTEGDTVEENRTEPTCAENGKYDLIIYCADCGEEMSKETVIIPATGEHVYVETGRTEATCKEPGVIYKACGCGNATITELIPVSAKHTFEGNWETVTESTCAKEGLEKDVCTVCLGHAIERVIPVKEHNYKKTVIAPSCVNGGETIYTCVNCRYGYSDDYTAALGHSFSGTVTAPTCDTQGYTVYECKRCAESYIGDIVDEAGHTDADGDGSCDLCEVDIVGSCRCLCHTENWLLKIIYKIICFIWKLLGTSPVCGCGVAHY